MDKLAGLIANLELSIRYLLSGLAVYAIYLMSISEIHEHITWITEKPTLAAFLVGALGFVVYSIYRMVFWIVGDGIAWITRISAPALERGTSLLYHDAYASFLLWRRKNGFDEAMNGYLHYRWAVVHFTFVVSITLGFAMPLCESGSIIKSWPNSAAIGFAALLLIASWQASFLFRVERELFRRLRNSDGQRPDQSK